LTNDRGWISVRLKQHLKVDHHEGIPEVAIACCKQELQPVFNGIVAVVIWSQTNNAGEDSLSSTARSNVVHITNNKFLVPETDSMITF
jgi:hypothetical protein